MHCQDGETHRAALAITLNHKERMMPLQAGMQLFPSKICRQGPHVYSPTLEAPGRVPGISGGAEINIDSGIIPPVPQ